VFLVELPITISQTKRKTPQSDISLFLPDHEPLEPFVKSDENNATILIIEDNPDVINYLIFCLENYGIIKATDGEQGIQNALESVPDLIITDIMMPGKDGYEVCSIIRSHEVTSHIPLIMLTARATQEEKKIGLSLGADAYLVKPFDREELIIRVEGLLSQRRLLQEKYTNQMPGVMEGKGTSDREDQFLDRIQQYIQDQLRKDVSVSQLAREMGMSRVQLYRKIKALTGKSVSQYVRLIRLYDARKLLRTSHLTISEITYQVGFSDPSYFTKAFKEVFQITPSEFRSSADRAL
jgi:YesN/AraC family two-component response regulator